MTTSSPGVDPPPPRPVVDGHVDLLYALQGAGIDRPFAELTAGPLTPTRLRDGGVRLLASALYCADAHNGPASAAPHLGALLAAEAALLGDLPLVTSREQLAACWSGRGAPGRLRLLENADALLEFGVAAAVQAGIVTVGLCHAGRNRLADGNAVASPGGLTAAGRALLVELAAAGRVVDVAHLAPPGFAEVVAGYSGPLVSSHTGLRPFCDRVRNLDAGQLAALFKRGGMLGLALAPELLVDQGAVDLEGVFRQLDWLVQRYGAAQVGLGSDFGGFAGSCRGLEDHGTLPALAARLERAGYPEAAIGWIMGENWRRFYAGILPVE